MKQQFNSKQLSTIFCAGLLTLSVAVYAQNNANISLATASNTMDPIIVTATRTPTKASNVLADNVYIGAEEIAQAGQTSLVELLQRQRSVEISSYGGGGATASVFLRGTNNAQSLVLIDGIRIESALYGGATWATIPLSLIDHIEIIFGPQSSLYGADAMGGVIHIFTKKGEGSIQMAASTGYGSYGTSISEASVFGSTGDNQKISYSLSASQELSTGFNSIANNNFYKQLNFPYPNTTRTGYVKSSSTGKLSQEWDSGQELGLQFLVSRLKNQYPISDYFDQYTDNMPFVATDTSNLNTFAAYSKNKVNENWRSLVQIAQSLDVGQNTFYYSNPSTKTQQNTYTWQNDIEIGTDLLQLLAERRTQAVSAQYISYPGVYGDVGLYPTTLSQSRNTNSIAGSYQVKRDAHIANVAVRNDRITGYSPQTTASASYGYFFTKEWRANINYGMGFKPPSFYELYYPNYGNLSLQAEKSKNTEVGLHYETYKTDVHLVAYQNTISNLIQTVQSTGGTGTCTYDYGCAANVASVKISGISLGLTKRIDNFIFKGSFDQQNPINQVTGDVLAKRAQQFGNINIEYSANRIAAGFGGTFSAKRSDPVGTTYYYVAPSSGGYSNTTGSTNGTMGGYSIFNTYASYSLTKDWSLFGRWNNIFNKNYQLSYGYNTPGSNVFIGLRYAMK